MPKKETPPTTTGQLREFLANAMEDVRNGLLSVDKASQVTKIAGQINESFYAEIKIAKVALAAEQQATKLGQLPINTD